MDWVLYATVAAIAVGISTALFRMPTFKGYSSLHSTFWINAFCLVLSLVIFLLFMGEKSLTIISWYGLLWGVLFAFTTILGWNYYGERCIEYLFGTKSIMPYRLVFIGLVASGAFLKLETIWVLADIVNGLMAIPNLIALLGLSGVVVAETKAYFTYWEKVRSRKKRIDIIGEPEYSE